MISLQKAFTGVNLCTKNSPDNPNRAHSHNLLPNICHIWSEVFPVRNKRTPTNGIETADSVSSVTVTLAHRCENITMM